MTVSKPERFSLYPLALNSAYTCIMCMYNIMHDCILLGHFFSKPYVPIVSVSEGPSTV